MVTIDDSKVTHMLKSSRFLDYFVGDFGLEQLVGGSDSKWVIMESHAVFWIQVQSMIPHEKSSCVSDEVQSWQQCLTLKFL